MRKLSLRLARAMCVIGGFALVATAAPAAATAATIALHPTSGQPTVRVTVQGAGFGAIEHVDVSFDATPVTTATTDGNGSFSAAFRVPSSATPGVHAVIAKGETSGLRARARFLVTRPWLGFRFDGMNSRRRYPRAAQIMA